MLQGRFCQNNKIPCIYRIQESASAPDTKQKNDQTSENKFVPSQPSLEYGRHYDLGIEGYSQITSPLRRYVDLIMQRQIRAFLENGKPRYHADELLSKAKMIDEKSRRIQRVDGKAVFYYKCFYLAQHIGYPFEALINHSPPPAKTVVLTFPQFELRLYVPLSCIEGLSARRIPPHTKPLQIKAICLEMDPDRAIMLFRIKNKKRSQPDTPTSN